MMTDNAAQAQSAQAALAAQASSAAAKCWKCKKEIGAADEFCRHCAARQRREAGFFFTPAGVWTIFLLLGPLNLWFLWLSPVISLRWKIIHTILTLLLTAAICWAIYAMLMRIFAMYNTYLGAAW